MLLLAAFAQIECPRASSVSSRWDGLALEDWSLLSEFGLKARKEQMERVFSVLGWLIKMDIIFLQLTLTSSRSLLPCYLICQGGRWVKLLHQASDFLCIALSVPSTGLIDRGTSLHAGGERLRGGGAGIASLAYLAAFLCNRRLEALAGHTSVPPFHAPFWKLIC
jgi:hypothetical protein